MTALEIARKLAALGETADARDAYTLAIPQCGDDPAAQLEAAAYILQSGGDYRISYTCFLDLYRRGQFRAEILPLLDKIFYEPNVKLLKSRYERNCKLLAKYPYLFREDFLPFDQLPIRFYPYDDHSGYVPFFVDRVEFGDFVNVKNPVVSRNFFKDLEKPVLAEDVTSQYELEYLRDNVRRSEDVGRENHIYLHYGDWAVFCAWLQVLTMRPLLEEKKIVFLIGDEIEQYPIDFKARFGIDYSQYPLKPIGIREVNRLIWHTQLSTHNGGDFFNEIFDSHPNLLCQPSRMMDDVEETVAKLRKALDEAGSYQNACQMLREWDNTQLLHELYFLRDRTDKDILVAMYLNAGEAWTAGLDRASRIAPALFFQPHFSDIVCQLRANQKGETVLESEHMQRIHASPIFRGFKYVKTFTPMRRFTTSHGATVKFMYKMSEETEKKEQTEDEKIGVVSDAVSERVFNRSFMIDPEDRLYRDSVLVRFEDGKLNPKATFTALAAFLDLPYTESMTYCSLHGERDPESLEGNDLGFSTAAIYRAYDEYVNDDERSFIEFFLRDAYEFYGYDFQYYDGNPVDENQVSAWIEGFTTLDRYIRETYRRFFRTGKVSVDGKRLSTEIEQDIQDRLLESYMEKIKTDRIENAKILLEGLRFVNKNGQPLRFMKRLELDPALLERPLYH